MQRGSRSSVGLRRPPFFFFFLGGGGVGLEFFLGGGVVQGDKREERSGRGEGKGRCQRKEKRKKKQERRTGRKRKKTEKKKKLTAAVALVPSRVVVPALRARPLDEPVRQESARRLRIELLDRLLLQQAGGLELGEERLRDRRLLPGRCPTEPVAGDAEPSVDRGVHGVVLVAERRAGEVFLEGLGLGRGAVLVLWRRRR